MLTTVSLVAVFAGLLVLSIGLYMVCLRLGLRWARVEGATWKRIAAATALATVLGFAVGLIFESVIDLENASLGWVLLELALFILVPCSVFAVVFNVGPGSAFKAWLSTLMVPAVLFPLLVFAVRPYLFEFYLASGGSMSPILLDDHIAGVCPECGGASYLTPPDAIASPSEPICQICDQFHVTEITQPMGTRHSQDRFAVAKFLKPRRWDIVVFRYPADPATVYVKRLVGLPGEEIHIEDGSVYVNGVKQTPPAAISGIKYVSEVPGFPGQETWGSVEQPAQLGEQEYFMLGDFSLRSMDSRFWRGGAPGYNPYAVPESHLQGVVTHTVWPLGRWRVHR